MINIDNFDILKNNKSTLKSTSKDTTNNQYMTDSKYEVVNFDKVVSQYAASKHMKFTPDSVDAFYIHEEDVAFIEFKNGHINNNECYNLAKKIYDSVCIFSDIADKSLRYIRDNINYILVYNLPKNPVDREKEYRESKSRNYIATTISGYAKKNYIRFGLDIFENYCFKNVYTYSKEEFKEKFTDNL